MNRVISFLCLAGLITFGLAAEVLATASTHIWAPSTDIQPFGKWHITADLYLPVKKDSFGVRWPTVTNLALTVGGASIQESQPGVGPGPQIRNRAGG